MKSFWKMPPRAKVYEALSAVADGRVLLKADGLGEVTSSSGDKKYLLEWSDDGNAISSNDNASYYQGYAGYPIIAVLLKLGRLTYNEVTAELLRGIPWKALNTKHKRNYDKAIEEALAGLDSRARSSVETEVTAIFEQLGKLELERGTVRRPPPPGR